METTKNEIKKKPILCLDFDGVCHSYTSGWQGADVISDPPVSGLFEFLEEAKEHFDIQVFSSRSNQAGGKEAMWKWFCAHYTIYIFHKRPDLMNGYSGFEPSWITFPTEKPAAFLTIDDRAMPFNGIFPPVEMLKAFQPWNTRTVDDRSEVFDEKYWLRLELTMYKNLYSQTASLLNTANFKLSEILHLISEKETEAK